MTDLKKLGIIGGLGPLATAYFYELVTDFTNITREQEHIEIIIHSRPAIPDRTAHILNPGLCPSPLPAIIETGKELAGLGCSVIAIPCVTAHCFYESYAAEIPADVIHMPRETAAELAGYGIKKAGIMATDGTVATGVLEDALTEYNIESVLPSPEKQKMVMDLIYNCVKMGRPLDMNEFAAVSDELHNGGAQVVILGCTELSLAKRESIGHGYIDVMEVLAKRCVQRCGGSVRSKYNILI